MSVSFRQLCNEISTRYLEIKSCGANQAGGGGFRTGNTCARGGASTSGFQGTINDEISKMPEAMQADLKGNVSIIKTAKDAPFEAVKDTEYAFYHHDAKKIYLIENKMARLPLEQQRQILHHEAAHLADSKYGSKARGNVLGQTSFGDTWRAERDKLSPQQKRIHSYFLDSKEAFAESAGLLSSGSSLTSQGRSAAQFKKAFPKTMEIVKSGLQNIGYLPKT